MLRLNTLGIAHKIIAEHVQPGDLCIDATAGRGHDTAFLCELVGKEGKVLAFDIQQAAVDSTRALLAEKGRFPLLPDIVEEYQRLERKQKGEGLCRLRCARDPGDQALGALARRLCKKYGYQSLTFAIELDPAVLGGFVLEIDGVTYDKSVQGQLHALAQNLREGGKH